MHFDGRNIPFLPGIFGNRRKEKPLKLPPSRSIADAFTEYINNEIPSRFIDTSKLQFVLRKDVLRVFQDEIAKVTEEQIHERMSSSLSDPLATYQPKRETILRQIIQEIVKYVVLSHRWETSGEATYQDITSGRLRVARFKKLVEFCMTSRRLGCKLAWIDTCCIDKTNAAEHSEAIHAMYKWYANSSLCMVYLAESTSYEDWDHDSWFTRGWTLQELLAPRRLKFFNKDWQPFNPLGIEMLFSPRRSKLFNKSWQPFNPLELDDDRKHDDVVHHLENVTGISKAVLTSDNSYGFHGRTFWETISWASSRQTTRIEDRAYCLVGLFRVNLTITYGEGQRAFSRLVEAIAAKNPSWDVFTWFGQPSVDHFALPLSPASYPKFKTHMAEGRAGVQEFTISPNGLFLESLPPISMELCSVVAPDEPGCPFHVTLKPRSDKEGLLGRYGDLVVKCGAGRLEIIRDARRLSACIINHHTSRSRKQGKLVVGADYICFLLYSESGGDGETSWMKLSTDNLLQISCVGMPDTTGSDVVTREPEFKDTQPAGPAGQKIFTLSLVKTFVQFPTSK